VSSEKPPHVTDWDIQAYGDGQVDADTEYARNVEAYLAAHPEAQTRLRAYRTQDEAIRARYRYVLAQPVPERLKPDTLRATRADRQKRVSGSLRIAAGVALVICAALIGWLVGRSSDGALERFADRTSAYLATQGAPGASGSAETLRSLSVLGGTPDFSTAGLELIGARPVDNGDMYEARYKDKTGRELRLFVAPDPQRHDNLLTRTEKNGRKVVYWKQGPLMYGLTGDFDKRVLDDFADTAIEQLMDRLATDHFAQTGRDAAPSAVPDGPSPAWQIKSETPPEVERPEPGRS
jgi:anti-sigma factor RsiW